MRNFDFIKKNNKGSTAYVIEESHIMPQDGVYEAELEHDNVRDDTIQVMSGASGTGTRIAFSLTTPSDQTWKRIIHVETQQPTIYISYESTGDQVEADDINELQDALKELQSFTNALASEVRGGAVAYTWGRLKGLSDSDQITINPQPQSLSIVAGDDAEFTIGAAVTTGTPLYRWQYEESGSAVWNDFTDGGKETLNIPTVAASWNGARIRCVVSDSAGNSKISDIVTLSVST